MDCGCSLLATWSPVQVSVGLDFAAATVLYNDSLGRGTQSATAGSVLEVVIQWACLNRPDFALTAMSQVRCHSLLHASAARCILEYDQNADRYQAQPQLMSVT